MCVVKKPSIPAPTAGSDKPLPILRNPILDGMFGNIAALRQGTNAFRIDLVNPLTIPAGGDKAGTSGSSRSGGGGGSAGGSTGGSSGGSSGGGGGGGGSRTSGGSLSRGVAV